MSKVRCDNDRTQQNAVTVLLIHDNVKMLAGRSVWLPLAQMLLVLNLAGLFAGV